MSADPRAIDLVLYSRPGCHLCDEARAVIAGVVTGDAVTVREVDIETDDRLHARYLERIPVLAHDGAVLLEGWITERALRGVLARIGGA